MESSLPGCEIVFIPDCLRSQRPLVQFKRRSASLRVLQIPVGPAEETERKSAAAQSTEQRGVCPLSSISTVGALCRTHLCFQYLPLLRNELRTRVSAALPETRYGVCGDVFGAKRFPTIPGYFRSLLPPFCSTPGDTQKHQKRHEISLSCHEVPGCQILLDGLRAGPVAREPQFVPVPQGDPDGVGDCRVLRIRQADQQR